MLALVSDVALVLSVGNFLVFLVFSAIELWDQMRRRPPAVVTEAGVHDRVNLQALTPDALGKLAESLGKGVEGLGNAADKLKKAGPAASAAALSVGCLLIALLAAGLELIPHSADGKEAPKPAPPINESLTLLTERIDRQSVDINAKFEALNQRLDVTASIAGAIKALLSDKGDRRIGPITISIGGTPEQPWCAARLPCACPTRACPEAKKPMPVHDVATKDAGRAKICR